MAKKTEPAVIDAVDSDAAAFLGEPIVETPKVKQEVVTPQVERTTAQRFEDFLLELSSAKDAKILDLDQFGKPNRWDAFQHVPHSQQRIVFLRVLIVDEERQ